VLGTAVAGSDGSVQVEIQIPTGTAAGTARVDLVGEHSAAVADVAVQVAAERSAVGGEGTASVWSLAAAAVALVGSTGALVSVAGRSRPSGRRRLSSSGA
jgi:hypothetical protein